MPEPSYTDEEKRLLLQTAADAIDFGLSHRRPMAVVVARFPPALQAPGAAFVTLTLGGALRGCVGSIHACRALVADVAENAYAASQLDSRFPPLAATERADLEIALSILTEPEPMSFRDETDLLDQLVPGRDGLLIEDRGARATFLPQVWEQLPDKREFLAHLKQKAGLDPRHWSDTFRARRYTVLHVP